MKIGNVTIEGIAALAPMAGVSDRAFRELCVSFGASYVETEMISSKGLEMGDRKSRQLAYLSDQERPAAIQIFGNDPDIMASSISKLIEYCPQIIDINMGCPVPKVAGHGSGAALMKDPTLAERIISSVAKASDIPVTVKIRAGWDSDSVNAVEFAERAESAGAAAVIVHGRTKAQMYAPPVDMDIIAKVKKAVSIPVIANGDITDEQSAMIMLEKTNADLLMIGRGALGNPWLFSRINAYYKEGRIIPPPPVSEKMRVMIKHVETICEYKGANVGLREARKHAAWYTKGLRGSAKYRNRLSQISDIDELREIAYRICLENE